MDIQKLQTTVGRQIQSRRLELGLSEWHLAEACDSDTTTIRMLETGNADVDVELFLDILKTLGFDIALFLRNLKENY